MNAITLPVPLLETEVPERAERRRFTAEYKRKILREAEACTKPGEIGALLRREGLHSSYLSNWQRARERAELQALSPKARGPKKTVIDARERKIAELEKEKARLEARLEQAAAVIELQKSLTHAGARPTRERRESLMRAVEETASTLGVVQASRALGIPRATYYRWLQVRRQAEEAIAAVPEAAPESENASPGH